MLLLLVVLHLGAGSAFLMTRVDPGEVLVAPGDSVQLLCQVDSAYEFCKWTSPTKQVCDFEWKRNVGNITRQECDFPDKVVFHAKYNDRECGITIKEATLEDQGIWECEIEDYVLFGSRGSGAKETGRMTVNVRSTTTSTTVTSTTARSRTGRITTTTTQRTMPVMTTRTTRTTTTESTRLPDPSPKSSEQPVAEPSRTDIDDPESAGSSAGVVGGVLLALALVVVAVFGVFYYRRRKAMVPVVNYATAVDSAGLTQGSQGITIHSASDQDQNTNYHEYYPPNMTYSTSTPQSDA